MGIEPSSCREEARKAMTTSTPQPSRITALRALADPMRLAVVDELAREDACACDLRERLDLSAPLLSHHLKVLRAAGLVRTQRVGRRLEVRLDREALARVAASLGVT
jgi:ArsR family transcriptional regulator